MKPGKPLIVLLAHVLAVWCDTLASSIASASQGAWGLRWSAFDHSTPRAQNGVKRCATVFSLKCALIDMLYGSCMLVLATVVQTIVH